VKQTSSALLSTLMLLALSLTLTSSAQDLPAPTDFVVERVGDNFEGRWKAVEGASYYEVWVEKFGRWSFNRKDLETSPFTSSFELRVADERSQFKVRAVDASGRAGKYSAEVRAKVRPIEPQTDPKSATNKPESRDRFDPTAPPPDPPTSLFTVWSDNDTIKLVWRGVKGAKNYSVEEFIEEKWVSIPSIEFPKPNTAIIKKHPTPGPYKFRIRSVGTNGRASEPSRPTTAKR
jgi:hypothetical protein